MSNDAGLVPDSMAHLPGAPFMQDQVDSALEAVRDAAGWHITPVRTETLALDVQPGRYFLQLPTLELVSVVEVRDTEAGTVIPASDYLVSKKLCSLRRTRPWPCGYGAVEVDLIHGYPDFPAALLPTLADAVNLAGRDQDLKSVGIDDFSQSWGAWGSPGNPLNNSSILGRYSLSGPRSLHGLGIA